MRSVARLLLALFATGAPVCGWAQAVIGDMFASDASVRGSVLFSSAGTQIQSGSSVQAGEATAVLKLKRGGEVRICPKTTVSVSSSPNGRDLLWGMNTGSLESHFILDASADTIMTPDFRILLPGPGIFHFAISSDAQGNACVKALPENTASLIVSELNGDGTYQVKPNVQVYFQKGSVANPSPFVPPDCGCPPAAIPVERAAEAAKPKPAESSIEDKAAVAEVPVQESAHPESGIAYYPPPPLPSASEALTPVSPLPPLSDVHLQMETPLVYTPAAPELEAVMAVSRLRLTSGSSFDKPLVLPPSEPKPEPAQRAKAEAPETAKKQARKGFFGKIGAFFSSVFK